MLEAPNEWADSEGLDAAVGLPPSAETALLRDSLSYIACLLNREMWNNMDRRTAPQGVSVSQWRFLRALHNEDGCSQRELSARVGLREPTTVKALSTLERDGLVRRAPHAIDKRKTNVFLTAKGRKLIRLLLPSAAEVNQRALENFTPAEARLLKNLMLKAVRNLTRDRLSD